MLASFGLELVLSKIGGRSAENESRNRALPRQWPLCGLYWSEAGTPIRNSTTSFRGHKNR